MTVSFSASITTFLFLLQWLSSTANEQELKRIGRHFDEATPVRIERNFFPRSLTTTTLNALVHNGVPNEEDDFPPNALKVIGDGGVGNVPQFAPTEYSALLRNFAKEAGSTLEKHSLVYYIENTNDATIERAQEILSKVADPSILGEAEGGTVHLYMSAPGVAALGNHTDTTDIVVLQLDGSKEWLLCSPSQESLLPASESPLFLRSSATEFSRKLDSCSSYSTTEMENLSCETTTLYPGDVLVLPRRTVHSARASHDTYSAHLTIGYKKQGQTMASCSDAYAHDPRDLIICYDSCDRCCDNSCDFGGFAGCDSSCNCWCDKTEICD